MRRWIAIVVLAFWVIPFATTLIGVGMGGGVVLSPMTLFREIVARDPMALVRVAAWAILLFPLILIWWVAYPKGWKNRHG